MSFASPNNTKKRERKPNLKTPQLPLQKKKQKQGCRRKTATSSCLAFERFSWNALPQQKPPGLVDVSAKPLCTPPSQFFVHTSTHSNHAHDRPGQGHAHGRGGKYAMREKSRSTRHYLKCPGTITSASFPPDSINRHNNAHNRRKNLRARASNGETGWWPLHAHANQVSARELSRDPGAKKKK